LVDNDTANIVDIHILNEAQDPYGRIKDAVLVLEAPFRKLNSVSDPFYTDSSLNTRGSRDQIRCTLDDQSRCSASSPIFVHPDTIYFQLGRWEEPEEPPRHETIFALVLEPTGRKNVHFGEYTEYRRVGLAEFPNDDELTRGWTKKKVAIV